MNIDYNNLIELARNSLNSALVHFDDQLDSLDEGDANWSNLGVEVNNLQRSIPDLISEYSSQIEILEFFREFPVDCEELGFEERQLKLGFEERQSDALETYLTDLGDVRQEATLVFMEYSGIPVVYCDQLIPAVEDVADAVQGLKQALTAKIEYLLD